MVFVTLDQLAVDPRMMIDNQPDNEDRDERSGMMYLIHQETSDIGDKSCDFLFLDFTSQ